MIAIPIGHAACAALVATIVAFPSIAGPAEPPWENLQPGKHLDGWVQRGGNAHYTVEGGELVGRSVADTPNSFLTTRKSFGDFVLEYDVKIDPRLNSGVQIRSESRSDYRDGVVHGYQVEIDPTPRGYSGGIYDESRRGWLYGLARNDAASAAFKSGDWNHFRVEAIGPSIRTWVNGVPAANLVDDMTASGFIGLQVHGVGKDPTKAGMEVRFRALRIIAHDAARFASPPDARAEEISFLVNQLTPAERAAGWKLLWDGSTTQGWCSARGATFPDHGWFIRDGAFGVEASGGHESTNGGDIVTTEDYGNFDLQVDFRITKGANSGIKYFVDPALTRKEGSAIGLEFQLLDDANNQERVLGVAGNHQVGSLYDLIAAENLSSPGWPKPVPTIGEWSRARIISRGSHVEHWLNGVKVVEYERGSQMFRALVTHSKYVDLPGFGLRSAGPILLQDHGDEVWFRSIKIRVLPATGE